MPFPRPACIREQNDAADEQQKNTKLTGEGLGLG